MDSNTINLEDDDDEELNSLIKDKMNFKKKIINCCICCFFNYNCNFHNFNYCFQI